MSRESALAAMVAEKAPATPVVEAEKATVPGPEAARPLDSTPFAALAKKEAEFVKRQQALKAEREELERQREALRPVAEQYKQYQETKAKDPVAALKIMGFTEEDILNYLANEKKPELTPEQKAEQVAKQAAEERIKAYEEEQKKAAEEAKKAKEVEADTLQKAEIAASLEVNKDKYRWCNYYGQPAVELVQDYIKACATREENPLKLTLDEAFDDIEAHFAEEDEAKMALRRREDPKPDAPPAEPKKAERSRTVSPPVGGGEPPKDPVPGPRAARVAAPPPNETKEQKRERLARWLTTGVRQ